MNVFLSSPQRIWGSLEQKGTAMFTQFESGFQLHIDHSNFKVFDGFAINLKNREVKVGPIPKKNSFPFLSLSSPWRFRNPHTPTHISPPDSFMVNQQTGFKYIIKFLSIHP